MAEKKTDLRVRYTLTVIKENFIKLLLEKPITKITVKEICEQAHINRATFYSHYSDQYDLLSSIEQEIMGEVREYLSNIKPDGLITSTSLKVLTSIMDYIRENVDICTALLSNNSNLDFQQDILEFVREQLISEWSELDEISKENAEYIFTYIANGSVGIIKYWMETGMKKSSTEIADMVWTLSHAKDVAENNFRLKRSPE